MIVSGNSRTACKWVPVVLGVPQGYVLEPLVFILFTADIIKLIPSHYAAGRLFAAQLIGLLAGCIQELTNVLQLWMTSNRLSLNS